MRVILAGPRGFCAGVVMAIDGLEASLNLLGAPVYVFHEIVHNKYVVERFQKRGVVFVNSLDEVPPHSNILFSAHGISPLIRELAREKSLRTIDATCPLVTKVHLEAIRYAKEGYRIILIGHEGHDEVIGTMGEAPEKISLVETPEEVNEINIPEGQKVAYLTQTTLSVDDAARVVKRLRQRFPQIESPPKEDICYATQNRQEAVRALASIVQLVLVVGSQNSSNSIRLTEVAREYGAKAYLVDSFNEIERDWFEGVEDVLLTAGASAPEDLVWGCVKWLRDNFGAQVEERTITQEDVHFPLPRELRAMARPPSSAVGMEGVM